MSRSVSNTYKSIMSQDFLPMTHFRITFGIEAPTAQSEAVFTSTTQAGWSDVTTINDEYMPMSNDATCELNQFILGSGVSLFSNDSPIFKDKFVSNNVSNADCVYEEGKIPTINIQFTTHQTLAGMTFYFDQFNNTFPTSMRITVDDGAMYVDENGEEYTPDKLIKMCYPTEFEYVTPSIDKAIALKIEILSTNLPMIRNIISRIYFGVTKTFTEENVEKVEQTYSLSPINNNLYKSEFKVSLDNFDLQYNIDNKQGIYKYLTEQQPISIEYSIDGISWITAGEYLTSGKAKISNNIATIEAIDQIQFMNGIYKKEKYRAKPISLYDLAHEVLTDFDWEPNEVGEYPFAIDYDLQNIYTKGMLPKATHAECLQLIASAGGVTLYVDDKGYICLKPLSDEICGVTKGYDGNGKVIEVTDYIVDFRQTSSYPEPEEIEPLSQVDVAVHTYTVKQKEELEELARVTVTLNSGEKTEVNFEYEAATNITIDIEPLTVFTGWEGKTYLRNSTWEIQVDEPGEYEIILKGNKIEDKKSTITIKNQEIGEIAPLDNPLITDNERATIVGTIAKDYLKQRVRYTIPWVQDYRVNVGDLIKIKTQFSEELVCRVIEIKTSEPALTGTMKVVVVNA